MNSHQLATVRVWDLPTRLFHWALVLCVIGLVVTSQIGGNAMIYHFKLGYAVLSLLLFRVVWGLIGGRWSRFASFLYAPSTVSAYLRGHHKPEHEVGHNPLGSGSVFALLIILLAQASTGLFSDDEISNAGPLTHLVESASVSLATWYHKNVGKFIILSLVTLHFIAIIFYKLKKNKNLIPAMIHGDKTLPAQTPASRDDLPSRVLALAVFAVCCAAVYLLVSLEG